MRTTVPRHVLLFSLNVQVCSSFVFHVSVFGFAQFMDELVDSVIVCQRARVFLHHRDGDRVAVFAVRFLRVGLAIVFCVGALCSHCLLWLCCGADRYVSTCCCVPTSSSFALLPWQGAAFLVSVMERSSLWAAVSSSLCVWRGYLLHVSLLVCVRRCRSSDRAHRRQKQAILVQAGD